MTTTIRAIDTLEVERYRNLFTNPSFEKGAGEVRIARGGPVPDSDPDFVISGTDMVGVGVAGVTSPYSGARGVLSGMWATTGAKSLRLIAVGSGAASGAAVALPFALTAGKTYTFLTKARLTAPLTGTAEALSRRIRIGSASLGFVASNPAPNVAGEHEIRWTVTPAGAYDTVQLWHGGAAGSPDIWYGHLLIIEGVYTGPYFDGATPDVAPFVYEWAGIADASQSIQSETVPVHTVTPIQIDGYEATRDPGTVVHRVINKTYPDVTLRAAGPRQGQLRLLFGSESDAINAYAAMAYPGVFTITAVEVPGIDMRFVVAEGELLISRDPVSRRHWWVEVPFVEVAP